MPRAALATRLRPPLSDRCVVELFVFLKMGAAKERIRVMELGGVDVRVALNRFDAARAKCFLAADQEKLLAVIESGFGSLAPFNSLIRGVFRDARATHLESLVVHLQREQTELKGMIESLLRHHGVPKVAPVEDELEA